MPEIGKVGKPSVERFKNKKRLYLVPLVHSIEGIKTEEKQKEYKEKLESYWRQVKEKIEDLEGKVGQVKRIYHEFVSKEGEAGLKAIKQLNENSFAIVKDRLEKGAELCAMEDDETLKETLDWQMCTMIGIQSQKAMKIIHDSYMDANKRRNEYIVNKIAKTLQDEEAGLIFVSEHHQLQFPLDIEVLYVAPPALDEVHRYLEG